jgi:hypothetical protein
MCGVRFPNKKTNNNVRSERANEIQMIAKEKLRCPASAGNPRLTTASPGPCRDFETVLLVTASLPF